MRSDSFKPSPSATAAKAVFRQLHTICQLRNTVAPGNTIGHERNIILNLGPDRRTAALDDVSLG
jgi:hypothetical protein